MRSMVSYLDQPSDPAAVSPPDWRLDFGDTQGPMDLPRGLPLRPLPLGFLLNTLIYAMIGSALLFAGTSLRRTIRRRRGQCLHCGYDLRGAPPGPLDAPDAPETVQCPECGRRSPVARQA